VRDSPAGAFPCPQTAAQGLGSSVAGRGGTASSALAGSNLMGCQTRPLTHSLPGPRTAIGETAGRLRGADHEHP
jgi:hypothetical protein